MRGDPGRKRKPMAQGLLTILFTDIENSTALTQKLGDAGAQAEVVRIHNGFVRSALTSRGGSDVKHTGDGIMATFPSATAAISCAIAIQEAARQHNREQPESAFNVRIGLNAGEPVAEGKDVFGTAVQLARRICDQADPGQILASDVVRQLVAGKGLVFDGLGTVELKGFDSAVPVFGIRAEAEVGEQLWQDAQAQQTSTQADRLLRRPVLAGAAVLGVGVAAAIAVVALTLFSGDGGVSGPDYHVIRVQTHSTGDMDIIRGDCTTTDIIFRGVPGASIGVTGDLIGEQASNSFEAHVRAATQCTSLSLAYSATYSFTASNSFSIQAAGYSTRPILGVDLDQLAGGAEVHDSGVIFGGTGVYAGIAGKSSCDSVGLRAGTVTGTRIGYEASNTCVFRIAAADELSPVTLSNAADATTITTQGGVSGANDRLTVVAVYHNNRDVSLTGLVLRLPAPDGVRLAPVSDGGSASDAGVSWALPDLAPDGVATFEFSVRLLSAASDHITLTPEITGPELGSPVQGDGVNLTVQR